MVNIIKTTLLYFTVGFSILTFVFQFKDTFLEKIILISILTTFLVLSRWAYEVIHKKRHQSLHGS